MIAETELFFGAESPLRRAAEVGGRPYEERPQQRLMATAVATHLDDGTCLCVEAPTGVGKTFAYLVPAVYFALSRHMPVVVSTHTISLQEQILEKDVPVLSALLGVEFTAAVLKGRSNYICLRRLRSAGDVDTDLLPSASFLTEFEQVVSWARDTTDGTRGDLPFVPSPGVWDSVCCERGNCLNAKCPYFRACFLMQARRRARAAQVVIVNHALFFSDLAMRRGSPDPDAGILPAYGAVILDEGHTIEECAATHLGIRVSGAGLLHILRRLYNPRNDRGLLTDLGSGDARRAVADAQDKVNAFFNRVADWLEPQEQDPLRYTVPNHIPPLLDVPLERVSRELALLAGGDEEDERTAEALALGEQVRAMQTGMHDFLTMALPDYVYWFDRDGRERRDVVLNAVPVEVGPTLGTMLFSGRIPIVVTSATLAVRGDMTYFRKRIGAESGDEVILDSPFDFKRQVTLYVPQDMPSPKDSYAFLPAACETIAHFVRKTDGRAFVLFTSYRMMHDIAAEMQSFFDEAKIELMVQGEGISRTRMLDLFRADVRSVIFGTASFWTGVDVPGEALSNVIIVRLPFAVPDHPLTAARSEAVEREGLSSFRHYSLPEAILRFRQGFGRLIRSREDTGIVVVLDNRIVSTSYGRSFMDSIPPCRVVYF